MKKIWDKGFNISPAIEKFTVGDDLVYDRMMAKWDIIGTLAHVKMLSKSAIIEENEFMSVADILSDLFEKAEKGLLVIPGDAEDIHSVIESELTSILGDTGKKIHAGRSRNDQVLTAIRLYTREQLQLVAEKITSLANLLISRAGNFSGVMMPGYTHMQIAMVSTFGMWFGTYAESLADDLIMLRSAWDLNNRNPLGTAAGYGSDLNIDREMTTSLLEFDGMNIISPYAQVSRGKTERNIASSLASVAYTMSKLNGDIALYSGQNFGFFMLPDEMTTGSSIMPQKKNPDVVEMIRGKCNRIQAVPNEMTILTANLPSGYHRDSQLLKEMLFATIKNLLECLDMTILVIRNIAVNEALLENDIYNPLLATNEVNRLVKKGIPFRDAYKEVSGGIDDKKFPMPDIDSYTHKGSPGNLSLEDIDYRLRSQAMHFKSSSARKLFEKIKKG